MNHEPVALLKEAVSAMRNAYCPYSSFSVGAALLADDGTIFCGCNVENVSYGLTICAERAAVFNAVCFGIHSFAAMAIVSSGGEPPSPCGACRQVMAEFCGHDFQIYVAEAGNIESFKTFELGYLLPEVFGRS